MWSPAKPSTRESNEEVDLAMNDGRPRLGPRGHRKHSATRLSVAVSIYGCEQLELDQQGFGTAITIPPDQSLTTHPIYSLAWHRSCCDRWRGANTLWALTVLTT